MTKEQLKELGLNDEQVEAVFADYGKNYVTKSQFNAKNEEVKRLKNDLTEKESNNEDLTKQLAEIQGAGVKSGADIQSLQKQVELLNKNLQAVQLERENERKLRIESNINAEVINALTKGNAHDPKTMAKLINSNVSVDGEGKYIFTNADGTTTDVASGVNSWLQTNLWAVKNTNQNGGETKQSANSAAAKITKEDFQKMTYSEKVSLYQNDNKLYNELTKGE